MTQKTFLFDKSVDLPTILSIHSVGERFLVIAPEKGNWITVDRIGLELVRQFQQGLTLEQAIKCVARLSALSFDDTTDRVSYTLRAIEANQFYERPANETSVISRGYGLHIYASMMCNLRCGHCYVDAGEALHDELSTLEILSVLDDCVQCNFKRITFSGGEPLLHNDWVTILDHAKNVGLSCSLLTNGTLINSIKTANIIAELADDIQVSLDGATEEVHDNIRGSGSYKRTLRGLNLLVEAGAHVAIAMTVQPNNIQDLEENAKTLAEQFEVGAISFRIATMDREGRARVLPEINKMELDQASKRILDNLVGPEHLNDCYSLPRECDINCGYGPGATLMANGDIFPCPTLYRSQGNIREASFKDIHQRILDEYHRTAVNQILLCVNCDLRYICAGGCRIRNEKENGTMLYPVCNDTHKKTYYDQLASS